MFGSMVRRGPKASAIALLLGVFVTSGGFAAASPQDDSAAPAAASLKPFLRTLDDDKTTRYVAAFKDLDGDGAPEAIVYMLGGAYCGSGGCDTFILKRQGASWRTVTDISVTQPPIRVLQSTSHGWRDLAVSVSGGGVPVGYEAELRFNGKSYPDNPTTRPARRAKGKPAGETAIDSLDHAVSLYP